MMTVMYTNFYSIFQYKLGSLDLPFNLETNQLGLFGTDVGGEEISNFA
jgi:hypothetical protein